MSEFLGRIGIPAKSRQDAGLPGVALKRALRFEASPRRTRVLAAIYCGVADVLALDNVDYVFGYVSGVIADSLKILGY
jgi:hypothetical protein